jgi:hypothetical protein
MNTARKLTKDELALVPYDANSANIPDGWFHHFWKCMSEDNLIKVVFYSGKVTDAYGFTLLLKTNVLPVMIFRKEDTMPMAMAWLSDIADHRAFAHFCCLKRSWGNTKEIADLVFDFWFNKLGLKLLMGLTPTRNKMAVHFLKEIGMNIVGEIPMAVSIEDKFESAIISYKTKE